MSVDLSKIKPGDRVTVRAVVDSVRDFEGGAQLLVKVEDWRRTPAMSDSWSYVGVNVDQIVSHTPKALSVGDRVRYVSPFINDEPDDEPWDLLFTDDSTFALIGRGRHTRAIKPLRELERIT